MVGLSFLNVVLGAGVLLHNSALASSPPPTPPKVG